jgi:hypothetical protein
VLLKDVAQGRPRELIFLIGTSLAGAVVLLKLRSLRPWIDRGRIWQLAVGALVGATAGETLFAITRVTGIKVIAEGAGYLRWALGGAATGIIGVLVIWYDLLLERLQSGSRGK